MTSTRRLPEMSRFTFGTGDIGQPGCDERNDRELVLTAMRAGCWLHSSPDYGGEDNAGATFRFLRRVFDEAGQRPAIISKLGAWFLPVDTPGQIRENAEKIIEQLGLERIDLAQLPCKGDLADDILARGPRHEALRRVKEDGLIGGYLAELHTSFADDSLRLARDDWPDGYIFYYNPIDRQASSEVCAALAEKGADIVALRTLGRVYVDYATWDSATAELHQYAAAGSAERIDALRPIFDQSGCRDWVEFSARFILSVANVRTTVGMTTNPEHLRADIAASGAVEKADEELVSAVGTLHEKWFGQDG